MESEPMLTPSGKNPFYITQDSEPNTLPTSYSGPLPLFLEIVRQEM